jgi:hypothetical protein
MTAGGTNCNSLLHFVPLSDIKIEYHNPENNRKENTMSDQEKAQAEGTEPQTPVAEAPTPAAVQGDEQPEPAA